MKTWLETVSVNRLGDPGALDRKPFNRILQGAPTVAKLSGPSREASRTSTCGLESRDEGDRDDGADEGEAVGGDRRDHGAQAHVEAQVAEVVGTVPQG